MSDILKFKENLVSESKRFMTYGKLKKGKMLPIRSRLLSKVIFYSLMSRKITRNEIGMIINAMGTDYGSGTETIKLKINRELFNLIAGVFNLDLKSRVLSSNAIEIFLTMALMYINAGDLYTGRNSMENDVYRSFLEDLKEMDFNIDFN